jgi:hypothetical protein
MACGKPNLQMIFYEINFWIVFDKIDVSASASTHLVKYYAAINMYFVCLTATENGLSRSMPYRSKGHAPEIEFISYGGIRDILLLN